MVGRVRLDQRQLQRLLEPRDLNRVGREGGELRVVARGLQILLSAPPFLREPVGPLELLQPPADVGRLLVVVVDGRVRHALLGLPV